MSNLDERLLAGQEQESEAARQLKEKKRGEAGEEGGDGENAGEPRSLRQRVQAARQALDLKERAKKKIEKIEEKFTAPLKQATSRALQWAWMTLIPSWGLSLIWINIHVFLKYVFGEKLFCKLGEEWLPKQATAAAGEAGKMANKSIGLVEVMALLILDLIVLSVVLGSLAVIALIVSWITNPWEALKAIWSMGWGAIQALVSLFRGLLTN